MPRRVVILTNFLPHYRVPLYEALMSRVGDLRVLLSTRVERDRSWEPSWGALNVEVQRSLRWRRTFRNVHGYRDLSEIHIPYDTFFRLRRYKPEVIVSGEFGLRTLLSVLYRMVYANTVLIVWATLSERTEATRGGLRTRLRRWILKRADGAFVNGRSGANYLASLGFKRPVFEVPYVVDHSAFQDDLTLKRDGSLYLLYAGQLIERKGLYPFLSLLSQWCADHPDRAVQLRVAGDGPERERIESAALANNLKLEILGNLNPQQLPPYYQSATHFVFPTLGDEWGTVVNEALSAGVPVLGSIHSQAVEVLICEGENGWQFDPCDPQHTYQALNRALNSDGETLRRMSRNARASIANLTPEIVAAKMADAIETLCEQRKRRSRDGSLS